MRNSFIRNNLIQCYAILLWLTVATIYVILKNIPSQENVAAYIPLIGEAGLDVCAFIYAVRLLRMTQNQQTKIVYLLLMASFAFATLSDAIYNLVLNVNHFQYDDTLIESLFDIPFAIFLFCQMTIWAYILMKDQDNKQKVSKWFYLSYVIISICLFTIFMFAIDWKIKFTSMIGMFQLIDTVLEVIGFTLAAICLARASTLFVRYLSVGYLLVVASDFIIRYHVISKTIPYLSSLEMVWMLGILIICIGQLSALKEKDAKFQLLPVNSLQSTIAAWLLILWLISVFMFGGASYLFSSGKETADIAKKFLSMLVPFSVLAIVCSSIISAMISAPLERLQKIVKAFLHSEKNISSAYLSYQNNIEEFSSLEKFIYDSFDRAEEKKLVEREFYNTASQVAHDIRSPLAVLRIMTQEMLHIADAEKDVMSQALTRINQIAEGLLVKRREITKDKNENTQSGIIYEYLSHVLAEKRIQYKDKEVNFQLIANEGAQNIKCQIDELEFKRVMSNLINNAVEAVYGVGDIYISLKNDDKMIEIAISDTGCGMPQHVIDNIETGITYNKKDGNGLGLKHAISSIKQWGGQYRIQSRENIGTTIFMQFNI